MVGVTGFEPATPTSRTYYPPLAKQSSQIATFGGSRHLAYRNI